jgi:hypothetical protein
VGAFYTGTEKGGSADETGGEAYYRFGFNEHLHVSLTSQVFDAARSDDTDGVGHYSPRVRFTLLCLFRKVT